MLEIQKYVCAESLEEAYDYLTKNRNNQIIAGMMWLKMQDRKIPVGIDLSKLGLDQIEEDDEGFTIGAMVSLRDLETHVSLNTWSDGMVKQALQDIVGVQFRNMATIGGSLYSRFGFSDIVTLLMVLQAKVSVYHGGEYAIQDYVAMSYERDILTHIYIRKEAIKGCFLCMRNSATDLSAFNLAMVKHETGYRLSIGARPKRAIRFEFAMDTTIEHMIAQCHEDLFEDNMRASKEYRMRLCEAFITKAYATVGGTVCK